ncbi:MULTISPECIES: hypothetical protein [Okeania]|nr:MULTISPECIES: hypothetical protein [Okeania]NET13679.1 hypothetical protein [Okeania sp. SIO1H6]NES78712.1 hypothetical protein [Okeania sp. SIO1H4]NES88769.1 hypothetical protein [Okeania sp. SIO2B9]NET22943.1 hypothetical protein [Okeania sp. SIO1H5]NET80011.1 hypothetical protein [Okeania sp. SIO1F9]
MKKEEERRKREEKVDGDSLRQAAPRLQTTTNCKHPVDGGVLNPKSKDRE